MNNKRRSGGGGNARGDSNGRRSSRPKRAGRREPVRVIIDRHPKRSSSGPSDEQNVDDARDEYYTRHRTQLYGQSKPEPVIINDSGGRWHDHSDRELLLRNPEPGKYSYSWARAAQRTDGSDSGRLSLQLQLVILRHENQYKSARFSYTRNSMDDAQFLTLIKTQYGRVKKQKVGLVEKFVSYKTIGFVYFQQVRAFFVEASSRARGPCVRWEVTTKEPITDPTSEDAQSLLMYRLKYPRMSAGKRTYVDGLNNLIDEGVVIDVLIKEVFDVRAVFWGVIFGVAMSLATALAYGFGKGGDFATGFTIASWELTVYAFLFAVVAAGEWFGLRKGFENSFIDQDIEVGGKVKLTMMRDEDY